MLNMQMILQDIAGDQQGWEKLLATMAANYKYSFAHQLYIYAQKPQATACANIQLWNQLGRWINKGAKGIFLPKNESGKRHQYVFDISDTYGEEITVWKFSSQKDETAVRAALQLPQEEPFREALLLGAEEAAATAAESQWEDYLSRDSHPIAQEEFRELIEDTVCQMVMLRTGLEPLSTIRHKELLHEKGKWLGEYISQCGQQVLRQIEAAVKHPERYLSAKPIVQPEHQEEPQIEHEKDNTPEAAEKQEEPQPEAPDLSKLPTAVPGILW